MGRLEDTPAGVLDELAMMDDEMALALVLDVSKQLKPNEIVTVVGVHVGVQLSPQVATVVVTVTADQP